MKMVSFHLMACDINLLDYKKHETIRGIAKVFNLFTLQIVSV